MSFLISDGHSWAAKYSLARVWAEAKMARRRVGARISTEAVVLQSAMTTILGGKKAGKAFQKLLEEVQNGG